jgi:ATP-binding protein involved in chromosome partitioning
MFKKIEIPILGMIQNMSLFTCPHCHNSTHIFGSHSGVTHACQKHGIDFLGDIPLHAKICDDADRGKPTVVSEPESDRARAFMTIAQEVGTKIHLFD